MIKSLEKLGTTVYYRDDDLNIVTEVLDRKTYARKSMGFDVEPGETWLDLGANIGAFGIYCRLRGARAVCYEPEPGCFEVLRLNVPDFACYETAVSGSTDATVPFRISNRPTNSRGTMLEVRGYRGIGAVRNIHIRNVEGGPFDGIKMDIEGAEMSILDQEWLPPCDKLVLEYHALRHCDAEDYRRHLAFLQREFDRVDVPPHFHKQLMAGERPFLDKNIHCMGRR